MAAGLVFVEEVVIAHETNTEIRKMKTMKNVINGCDKDGTPGRFIYSDLLPEEQKVLQGYYESVNLKNNRRMMIMARESSIQLTYQKALLLYQYVYPPLLELDFTNGTINELIPTTPSTQWIIGLVIQIISILSLFL